jgi:hypothetical protein
MFLRPCPGDLGRILFHPKRNQQSINYSREFFESKNPMAKP